MPDNSYDYVITSEHFCYFMRREVKLKWGSEVLYDYNTEDERLNFKTTQLIL